MKEAFEIATLIRKEMLGTLNAEEKLTLSQWRSASSSNETAYSKMRDDGFYESVSRDRAAYDPSAAYELFNRRRQRPEKMKLLFRISRVAVAVIAVAAVSVFFFDRLSDMDDREAYDPAVFDIPAGNNKATLTLSDGSTVELSSNLAINATSLDGAKIIADGSGLDYSGAEVKSDVVYNEIRIPRGGESFVILSDGTKVWLNSETRLRFPVPFAGNERCVEIEGEVYLEVSHNPEKPFIIVSGEASVRVLGTSFNFRSYPENRQLVTTLTEGAVSVTCRGSNVTITPGQQVSVDLNNGAMTVSAVDTKLFTAWKDGRIAFSKQPLWQIVESLERWYDIDIEFVDENAKNITFSGNLRRYEHFSSVVRMLQITGQIEFTTKNKTIYIEAL